MRIRTLLSCACMLLACGVLATPSPAQFQNPITAAKDAYKKAKEQQKQQQKPQPPAQQQTPPRPGASTAGANADTSATPWTPPGAEQPAVPVKLDPLKLPDVIGVRLGTAAGEGLAAVRRQYPTDIYQKLAATWWPGPDHPDYGYTVLSSLRGNEADVHLSFTAPPGPQLVWRVMRFTHRATSTTERCCRPCAPSTARRPLP